MNQPLIRALNAWAAVADEARERKRRLGAHMQGHAQAWLGLGLGLGSNLNPNPNPNPNRSHQLGPEAEPAGPAWSFATPEYCSGILGARPVLGSEGLSSGLRGRPQSPRSYVSTSNTPARRALTYRRMTSTLM